jgi:hypothetical protein
MERPGAKEVVLKAAQNLLAKGDSARAPAATLKTLAAVEKVLEDLGSAKWGSVTCVRAAMRKLMLAHREQFPAPVHEGSAALWHLAPVLLRPAPRSLSMPIAAWCC